MEICDVTVILTAYKRIDSLRSQIDSLKKQSFLPKEIWLFQDKVNKDYTITLEKSLLDEFDNVFIATDNIGVWGRFDFARKVHTKYVCIFDDDTIPGSRWIENCMENMKKQRGIYGAIGVAVLNSNNYPYSGYCRVGWQRPNSETCMVDFVGHSWFFEKEWLHYMFDEAKDMKKYKYAAEDMSLSYAALLHGINTYVPAHPFSNYDLWGSKPDLGTILGQNNVSLSGNGNDIRMNNAIKELEVKGWNFVYKRDPVYIKKLKRISDKAHRIVVIKKILRLFERDHKTF
ncbi:Glycosyl transferase family 2 [Succinivibrio dextrinosolvens]|uniref:glycosyltransferase family 2 protein n=1 Tax=Succinivibrio dextrinosolvens TaxID=83771 RepID=UPI0008DFC1FC|nr:glycosyltransferase family A protein [Succinivibrio dextrinosolvens]SFS83142.1 Glycosyl transferase family 2 [Succinivibrio dextrinosolvens]